MKVLHINNNYMGTKLHQTMIEHLNDENVESTVFCPIDGKYSRRVTVPNSNVIVSDCFKKIDRFFFFRKQHKIISSVLSNVDCCEYDCIHAYTLFTDGNCAYDLSRRFNIPYVVAVRSTDLEFFKYRKNLWKRGIDILINANAVFFLSEKTQNHVLSKYIPLKLRNKIQGKSIVIPNGIDDYWFCNKYNSERDISELDNQYISLCCVSEIIPRKNIPRISKVMDELEKKGWKVKLDLIGKKTNEKEYLRIIKDSRITYHSPVNKDVLINYYRNANMFVLLSKNETFGLVYAEAMSQGVPVIYSKHEGFDGQFENGEVGFAVDINNYREIANCIEKIVANYNLFSTNCINKINRFKWTGICKKYTEIYKNCCGGCLSE